MKVVGTAGTEWDRQYVAIVSHSELERLSDRRYGQEKLPQLKIGGEFDLGSGCDFRDQIKHACSVMVKAMEAFEQARSTMTRFAVLIATDEAKP